MTTLSWGATRLPYTNRIGALAAKGEGPHWLEAARCGEGMIQRRTVGRRLNEEEHGSPG